MRPAPEPRTVASVACLALAVVCRACGSAPADHADGAAQQGAVITVGSFDFPESVLLADIYADALTTQGFPVRVLPDLGPRELVDPALMSGLVQVVPEYSGSALEFVSVGRLSAASDAAATGWRTSAPPRRQQQVKGMNMDRTTSQRNPSKRPADRRQ